MIAVMRSRDAVGPSALLASAVILSRSKPRAEPLSLEELLRKKQQEQEQAAKVCVRARVCFGGRQGGRSASKAKQNNGKLSEGRRLAKPRGAFICPIRPSDSRQTGAPFSAASTTNAYFSAQPAAPVGRPTIAHRCALL